MNVPKHQVNRVNDKSMPMHSNLYRAKSTEGYFSAAKIDRMLTKRAIQPVTTKWAAYTLLEPKVDVLLRLCIDYRKVKAVTFRDSYPLPSMDEFIDSLGERIEFSTLNANVGYWQIEIDKQDHAQTSFMSDRGLYGSTRVSFGLSNVAATLHRAKGVTPVPVHWKFELVYFGDIVIFSKSSQAHIEQVRRVLRLLYKARDTLHWKKSKFFSEKIYYMNHANPPEHLKLT